MDNGNSHELVGEREDGGAPLQLTLMTENKLYTLQLPLAKAGEFQLLVENKQVVSIFARENAWIASGTTGTILDKTGARITEVVLYDGGYWYLMAGRNRHILFAEESNLSNFGYQRYAVGSSMVLGIGRSANNDIHFSNPYVSKRHATLTYKDGVFNIDDLNSANGLYVNGSRAYSKKLSIGDVVSVLSMRIIIGVGFIAINDSKVFVSVNMRKLERFVCPSPSSAWGQTKLSRNGEKREFFNRLPRRRLPMKNEDVNIEMPPFKISHTGIPLMLRMGGSVAASATSLFTGNPLMLLSTILFPFLSEKYSEKQREDYEARRIVTYTSYLKDKRREIQSEKLQEERVLRSNYPELNTVLCYPTSGTQLWERRKVDDDFLSIRLGTGSLPMIAKVHYPKVRMTLEDDDLEDEMYELAREQTYLEDVPILLSLLEHRMCGVIGGRQLSVEFARQIILRIATLYSYDEVKLVVLARPSEMVFLSFARYLPHVWNDQRTKRFVAMCASDAYLIGEHLAKELDDDVRGPRQLKRILKERPYYVVIALDKQLQDCMEIIKTCSQLDENCGLSVISIFADIPKDCTAQIALVERGLHLLSNLRDIEREDEHFRLDSVSEELATQAVFAVSNKVLKAVDTTYSLPKSLSFLEMYSVGKIQNLNILKRWEESDPVSSLAVPIGIDTSGSLFTLDLHQKYQGPHGLVAGMTGSGKSEFLLTYILSMAINFRPDEVSFLLIDYKGGGLAGAFEDERRGIRLPHLAGTITNLDGSAIQRSLISLQSETLRRQRIFNEAKTISGESTMDIYVYQRLYRQGVVDEPITHLLIIADEFAELHAQQREFLDQLISIARIGRSLGIHLILATQKPGGLVNDQILSNTKFRVCLKVQTREDSNEMLKRPEAAELHDAGRFYLQVGYNELFALGQSAWSGAPYTPQERIVSKVDRSISLIDDVGGDLVTVKPKEMADEVQGSQIASIVKALSDHAADLHLKAARLWKPTISTEIDFDELDGLIGDAALSNPLHICMGMIDDPERQEQYPLLLDFSKFNNMMVSGTARSGKTTFVQTALLQLLRKCTPNQLNFYILDYSSRLMSLFRPFQHCGAVLTEAVGESLDSFFNLIDGIIDQRKTLFENLGVDSVEAASAVCEIPIIFVIIDNFSGMKMSKKGEDYAYQIDTHLKRGTQYGVKYIITCSHPNEVNVRARREIDKRIALWAKDKYDYEEILGCKVGYLPPDNPGRGLCVIKGRPLEMQVACVGAALSAGGRLLTLKNKISSCIQASTYKTTAKRLPYVDESISYADFCEMFGHGCMPLGYHLDGAKPISLPFRQFTGLSLYFGNESSTYPVLSNVMCFALREKMQIYVIRGNTRNRMNQLFKERAGAYSEGSMSVFEPSDEGILKLIQALLPELKSRQSLWDKHRTSEVYKKGKVDAFDFMRTHTNPWLLVFEGFEEACCLGVEVTKYLCDLIPKLHEFNMYVIGCFYPSDKYGLKSKDFAKSFNQEDLVLLFGGRYSEQKCTDLPNPYARISSEGDYNRCLMKYRNKLYSLLVPCEEEVSVALHKDDRSIFE